MFASRIGSKSTYGTQSYVIKRDTYYHLIFAGNGTTGNGTTFDAYVDSNKINTAPISYGVLAGSNLSGLFYVGHSIIYGGGGGGYLKGYIDDVHIYNSILSSSRIKQNYLAGLDSLLAKGGIDKEEYIQRIEKLAQK